MTLRAGVVGCGNISDTHARAAREAGLELTAFLSREPLKAGRFAGQYGGRPCSSLEEFLEQPMDLALVGSPSGLHAEPGIALAARGCHVLVEKPLDARLERGRALVEAAERNDVRLGVLFQDRLKPALVQARRLIAAGGLGRVLLASARVKWHRPAEYYASSSWRGTVAGDGGAALVNQGIHTVDLLLWLLGPVVEVRALTGRQLHAIEGEDVALALLQFASGALGTLEATTVAWPGYPRRVEISGTEGTLVIEGDRIVAADLKQPQPGLATPAAPGEAAATAVVSDTLPHRRMIEDFVEAIGTGARPACDGREGLRSLALVQAVYASAAHGRVERL